MSMIGYSKPSSFSKNQLIVETTCGPDNDYAADASMAICVAGNSIIVYDAGTNLRLIVRSKADLSYQTKFKFSGSAVLLGNTNYTMCYNAGKLYLPAGTYICIYDVTFDSNNNVIDIVYNTRFGGAGIGDGQYTLIRGVATDGTSLYISDTSGHRITKTDLIGTFIAKAEKAGGGSGAGNGEFNNPEGLCVIGGKVYIVDYSNNRVQILTDVLVYDSQFTLTNSTTSICSDGTNLYTTTLSADGIQKWSMVGVLDSSLLGLGTGDNQFSNPNSICIDSGQLYIQDKDNERTKQHLASNLSYVAKVGSSGDGSASLFDPVITLTTGSPTQITWQFDTGEIINVASGANISWHGFAGYTFPIAGPHWAICRTRLGQIATISIDNDYIKSIKGISKCKQNTVLNIANFYGSLDLNELINCKYTWIYLSEATGGNITGSLNLISPYLLTNLYLITTHVTGTLTDLPSTITTLYLQYTTSVTAASIAHITGINSAVLSSNSWLQASVDLVLASMYTARAAYTYAAPSLQIGGTNAAPSGNYIAPVEGADWHEDPPGFWNPLTGKAMIYALVNDPNAEGFNAWTITYTA